MEKILQPSKTVPVSILLPETSAQAKSYYSWLMCVVRVRVERERFELMIAPCFFFCNFSLVSTFGSVVWTDDSTLANNFLLMILQYPFSSYIDKTVYNASSNAGWLGLIDELFGFYVPRMEKFLGTFGNLFICSSFTGFRGPGANQREDIVSYDQRTSYQRSVEIWIF